MTNSLPRLGILGVMQALYDEMIPGITERQAGYTRQIADALKDVAEWTVADPVKGRDDAERAMRMFENVDLDGVMIVMLTYGPAMRVARVLNESRLPILLANTQPEPSVSASWDMADMTYNQGIHGAQDTANAMVRAGRPFHVLTEDWHTPRFSTEVARFGQVARAITAWRSLKVAVFGYAMNQMGDIRVDENALLRSLGPQIDFLAPGELWRRMQAIGSDEIAALRQWEDRTFDVDPRLSEAERDDHARMQLGIESLLTDGGYRAYSAHFDAIGQDGRFARLPMAAASSLMAKGYGYGAEGDALAAAMVYLGHQMLGDANFTEMYAMDFPTDSILMSHMGEGNYAIARDDEPTRLIKRPLGIGGLDDPPTFVFRYRPGLATIASLVSLGGERFRIVVAEGENLDLAPLPALEMPYGHFHPAAGLRDAMDGWLAHGGTHHMVMNLGHHAEEWQVFCRLAGIEYVHI